MLVRGFLVLAGRHAVLHLDVHHGHPGRLGYLGHYDEDEDDVVFLEECAACFCFCFHI
jgi:hypothetical protein